MPCSDSSSSIAIQLDPEERLLSFDFAKITCGREITGETGFDKYLKGKTIQEILDVTYNQVLKDLNHTQDEAQFILYLEWDALRSALVQYLGSEEEYQDVDKDRCQITSIEHTEKGIEIALVVLPPNELPKILPCSLGDKKDETYRLN